ncbi:DUF4870 domain-containing protein [Egicoccus sp. AB-alg2]|uniref:DUF4870 domain-containing protein n=1 Tax=Egicoccus sp. AB-alg2 TaxID=3242693 RepID=UPI00359DDB2E
MTCQNCGASLESTATTCPVCGTAVAAGPTAGQERPVWDSGTGEPAWQDAGRGPGELGAGAPTGSTAGGWQQPGGPYGAAWGQPQPHPSGLPGDIRGWGIGAHASAYLAFVGLPIIGPLLVWLLKREHPFVDHHGKESLNFNLSVALYGVILVVAAFPIGLLTVGIGLIPIGLLGAALGLLWLILPIVGCIKASNGEGYRYPMTIRFVR